MWAVDSSGILTGTILLQVLGATDTSMQWALFMLCIMSSPYNYSAVRHLSVIPECYAAETVNHFCCSIAKYAGIMLDRYYLEELGSVFASFVFFWCLVLDASLIVFQTHCSMEISLLSLLLPLRTEKAGYCSARVVYGKMTYRALQKKKKIRNKKVLNFAVHAVMKIC